MQKKRNALWPTAKKHLVRIETSPEDIQGMHASMGILTARGGMTSHAAVVARGMGKCCVVGCDALRIDYANRSLRVGEVQLQEGDRLTLDGTTGEVFRGEIATEPPQMDATLEVFMGWVDEVRRLNVRANADTPQDALTARQNGAEGIGLCRTEHMFFAPERIFGHAPNDSCARRRASGRSVGQTSPHATGGF